MLKDILAILAAFVQAIGRYIRAQEQEKHEKNQQDIKQDPAGWMDDHFNGNANRMPNSTDLPGNANEADKAYPAKPDEKP